MGDCDGENIEPVEQVFPKTAVADLILQIPVGGCDDPDIRPGECPPFPPEELAFHQGRRQGRTVDCCQRPVLAGATAVDGASDHSLAGAGLAQEKNRRILGRHLLDPEEYLRQVCTLTNDLAKIVLTSNFLLKAEVFRQEPSCNWVISANAPWSEFQPSCALLFPA